MRDLASGFAKFAHGSEATIVWAAGAQGVADSHSGIASELESFRDFAQAISSKPELHEATVAIISSAGGVYSGSLNPPFTVTSPITAINQYGLNKIAIEDISRSDLSENFRVHIARVTNLYGSWSGPRQGLVNRLCYAAATREALQIYVPLDTVRDYIYVDDAAALLFIELNAINRFESSNYLSLSLVGSGENTSIGSLIDTVTHVTHRKVPVTLAQLDETRLQPRDLRMSPTWIERDLPFHPLPLAQGVKKVFDSLVTLPRWLEAK
jgi:UDP-glucose 4-epimerase